MNSGNFSNAPDLQHLRTLLPIAPVTFGTDDVRRITGGGLFEITMGGDAWGGVGWFDGMCPLRSR
jgi:hypothetical protein